MRETKIAIETVKSEQGRAKIHSWLLPPDPSTNLNSAREQRHASSGSWFLEESSFCHWRTTRNSVLWLYGKPGCGKTILSSTVITHLKQVIPQAQPILYFFFDFADSSKQDFDKMLRTLISQLDSQYAGASQHLDSLFDSCKQGREQPSCDQLCKIFLDMLSQVKESWLILDALDECVTRRDGMLSWLADISKSSQVNIHLLATSRPEHDIHVAMRQIAPNDAIIDIKSSSIVDDIHCFVHETVRNDKGLQRWRKHPDVQTQIETMLMKKVDGM